MTKNNENARIKQTKIIWLIIAITYICVWLIPVFTDYSTLPAAHGTAEAVSILRDHTQYKWYAISLLLIVIYMYAVEVEKKNWSGIFAGIAFFLWDAFNEVWNELFYLATGKYAGVWMCSTTTAYEPLIGWNLEIIFMFLVMGISSTKIIPKDKDEMVFGKINNRHFYAFLGAVACVVVEIILNLMDVLIWNYSWWQPNFPFIVFIIGYWPFWEIAFFVYDLPEKKDQIKVLAIIGTVVLILAVVFIPFGYVLVP